MILPIFITTCNQLRLKTITDLLRDGCSNCDGSHSAVRTRDVGRKEQGLQNKGARSALQHSRLVHIDYRSPKDEDDLNELSRTFKR
jgi:hypothetical protein